MARRDRDSSGSYIDPFAFLPKATNMSRQLNPGSSEVTPRATRKALAKPEHFPAPKTSVHEAEPKPAKPDKPKRRAEYMRMYMAKRRATKGKKQP